jgi:hypothetical protein
MRLPFLIGRTLWRVLTHSACLTALPSGVVCRCSPGPSLLARRIERHLGEELRTIALFDRVHDCTTNPDPAENRAYAVRQMRRSQIMDEIRKLSPPKPEYRNHARTGSAVLLLCAVGYAALHYLLK